MTVDQSVISDIGSNVAHARAFRAIATAFLRSGGLVSAGDLTVTGDPVDLAVNVSVGVAFVPMNGARQYYEPFIVDATEKVTLNPATSARTDLIYAGIHSREFGDPTNDKGVYVEAGPPGSTAPPQPFFFGGGTLKLASVKVPQGATRGSQCTITPLASTTAPTRDGGYTAGDVKFPAQPETYFHRSGVGPGGHIVAHNAFADVPRMVACVGTYPFKDAGRPDTFVPNLLAFDVGRFEGYWYGPDGNPVVVPSGGYIEFVAIMFPGDPLTIPPPS